MLTGRMGHLTPTGGPFLYLVQRGLGWSNGLQAADRFKYALLRYRSVESGCAANRLMPLPYLEVEA